MYTSERAAETAIRELGVGWTVFPYDDSERGVLGYCAAKDGEERVFQWALFGQALEPDVQLLPALDLVAFLRSEPRECLHASDAPKMRQLGFVSYRLASEGKALVRRVSLTKVKELHSHPRAVLMENHDKLMTSKGRTAAARAIKPYGWPRVLLMKVVRKFFPIR